MDNLLERVSVRFTFKVGSAIIDTIKLTERGMFMERNFRKNKKMKKKLVAVMVSAVMLTTSGFGTNFSGLNNVLDVRNVYAAEDVDMSVIEACQNSGHEYVFNAERSVPQTCENGGYDMWICKVCLAEEKRNVTHKGFGHSYAGTVHPPTCLDDGYTEYVCGTCGDSYIDDNVSALGHSYDVEFIRPTTTTKGYTIGRCTRCTEEFEGDYIAATPNAYFDYKTLSLVLSDKAESMKYSLDRGITWITTEAISVQFTEAELEKLMISDSGEIKVIRSGNAEKAIADSYVQTVEIVREEIPNRVLGVAPTEDRDGLVVGVDETMEYRNENSSQWLSVVGETIANLKPGVYYIRVKSTENSFASESVKIIFEEPEHITHDQLGTVTIVKEPTCEEDGLSHVKCSKCDYYIVKTIRPLGHNMEFYAKQQPTCTKKGYDIEKCTRCDYTSQTNFVPTIEHEYIIKEIVEPTCTKMGYTIHQCKNCDSQYKDSYTEPISHIYKFKEQVNATCTLDGYNLYECANGCGTTKKDFVSALGHNIVQHIQQEASCEKDGISVECCARCDYARQTKLIPALGHKYTSTVIKPTNTAQGYTLHKCVNCGAEYKDSYVAAIGTIEYDKTKFKIDDNGVLLEYLGTDKEVVIPDGVTQIGDGSIHVFVNSGSGNGGFSSSVFRNCDIISVIIPNSVTKIEAHAFEYCKNLKNIIFPDSVTYIGNGAFSDCSSLTSVIIPDSITNIEGSAFSNCSTLEKIVVEENNPIYDSRDNCNGIIETSSNELITGCKNTVIPNSISSIGADVFYRCSGLTSITIPNNVTSIGRKAFSAGSSLEKIIVDEDNPVYDSRDNCNAIIKTSSNELLLGCKNTVIPDNVTSIGNGAFSGCSGLTSIDIPDGVTRIEDGAFSGCSELTSITIPSSVTSIANDALVGCDKLTTIKGYTGSYAETYAKENDYNFVALDNVNSDDTTTQPSVTPSKPVKDKAFYNVTGNDDDISLSDAQKILRYALRIENSEVDYTLSDAQTCLRIALRIIVL